MQIKIEFMVMLFDNGFILYNPEDLGQGKLMA